MLTNNEIEYSIDKDLSVNQNGKPPNLISKLKSKRYVHIFKTKPE
jgi:hypothetical protein